MKTSSKARVASGVRRGRASKTRTTKRRRLAKRKGAPKAARTRKADLRHLVQVKRIEIRTLRKLANSVTPSEASQTGYRTILARAPIIRKLGGEDTKLLNAYVSAYAKGAMTYHDQKVREIAGRLKRAGYEVKADLPGYAKPPKMRGHVPDIYATKARKTVSRERRGAEFRLPKAKRKK